ncbi:MAG: hypothetical protein LBC88_02235 [Spirochaetaceae bacterium]|jgi:hypothetical protein|nr:hypothetical protein [Spirochaetaceae bacterium]
MNRRFGWRLPVLAVVVGLVFLNAGCASLANMFYQGAETAESKKFLDGANDILTQSQEGYPALQFKALFERKFTGIIWNGNGADSFRFTYEGRQYTMEVSNIPRQQGNMQYFYWVAATGCKDMTPPEQN